MFKFLQGLKGCKLKLKLTFFKIKAELHLVLNKK